MSQTDKPADDVSVAENSHLQEIYQGLEVERDRYLDTFIGTKEDLIAAGLAAADMFPVWPKRTKYKTIRPGESMDDHWSVNYIKGGKFVLSLRHPERKPIEPPITAIDYRKQIESMTRTLDVIIELAKGGICGNNPAGFHLENVDEIARQAYILRDTMLNGTIKSQNSNIKKLTLVK